MKRRSVNTLLLYKQHEYNKTCVKTPVIYTNGLKAKLSEFYLMGWGNWNARELWFFFPSFSFFQVREEIIKSRFVSSSVQWRNMWLPKTLKYIQDDRGLFTQQDWTITFDELFFRLKVSDFTCHTEFFMFSTSDLSNAEVIRHFPRVEKRRFKLLSFLKRFRKMNWGGLLGKA